MTDPSLTPEDIAEVAHRLRLATACLARQLRQQAGTGLSPSQFSVLTSIDVNGSVTLGELAAIEQVAPPTITKIVSKLEEDGLVVRTVDSRDRRVARVSVSEGGRARLDHSRSRRDAWLTRRLEEVTPEEIAQVSAALPVLEAMAAGTAPPHREGDALAPEPPALAEAQPEKEPSSPTVTK